MFERFYKLISNDIGIDLGTSNTLVYLKGHGIVINEPSVVAVNIKTNQVLAVGMQAKEMLGRTPGHIRAIRPLVDGVISDFEVTEEMLSYLIGKADKISKKFGKPRVVVGVPSGTTNVETRAVYDAARSAGAREVFLVEEPMAAAVGAGVSVFEPTGVLIVDIGGGTTEIAVISLGGIVVNRSLKIAGNEMDQAIIHYIRLRHGLLIGEKTAEEVKIKIGSAYKGKSPAKRSQPVAEKVEKELAKEGLEKVEIEKEGREKIAIIRGRDIETGLPKSLRINETEIREAIGPVVSEIVDAIMEVIEETPPELTADILEHGIMLTGGGSLLPGVDELIIERTKIPVILVEDPLTTVVRGTAKLLEDTSLLNQVKVTGGLR